MYIQYEILVKLHIKCDGYDKICAICKKFTYFVDNLKIDRLLYNIKKKMGYECEEI